MFWSAIMGVELIALPSPYGVLTANAVIYVSWIRGVQNPFAIDNKLVFDAGVVWQREGPGPLGTVS